jgi:hypothetical protein
MLGPRLAGTQTGGYVIDWSAWSREAVAIMQQRNDAWQARFELTDAPFDWDLESATIRFQRDDDQVVASLCLVGTTAESEGTFLWAWANDAIPSAGIRGLDAVRRFGETNGLALLTSAELRGARPQALEILAIAGRILNAEGVFIAPAGDVTCFFALDAFRIEPAKGRDAVVDGR